MVEKRPVQSRVKDGDATPQIILRLSHDAPYSFALREESLSGRSRANVQPSQSPRAPAQPIINARAPSARSSWHWRAS